MDERVSGAVVEVSKAVEDGAIIAGKYTVLRPDTEGPASMFVCRENAVDEPRSVWLMQPSHRLDPNGEQFLAELGTVAKLVHPQLRKVLDFGREQSGLLYVVYETLELRNLTQLLDQDWPLTDERVVWLACQLLAVLEVAHAAGLTHGNLRPEHLLVRAAGTISQNEEIVLSGLGLTGAARYGFANRESRPHLNLTEWMEGTPPFAAPEQFRGEPRDPRSDIYGVGLLLFQLLTRTAPFLAANELDTAWMQCFTPPPAPSGYGQVSTALEAVCLKALTKTPDLRYQTANEMRAALLEAQARGGSRVRLSRPPSSPSHRAIVVATRNSSSSIVPVRILPSHSSESDRLARLSVEAAAPNADDALPEQPSKAARRKSSASLLIACSALAIVAALVLPDLKLREPDAELVVQAEPGEASVFDEPAELPPIELPTRKAPVEEVAAAVAVVPTQTVKTPAIEAAKPQLRAAKGSAVAAATVQAPTATPAPVAATPRREPAHLRMRTIEKTVVAADASDTSAAHAPVAMEVVTSTEPVAVQAPEVTPTATTATAEAEAAAAEPSVAAEPQPTAATAEPTVAPATEAPAAAAPVAEPAAEPAAVPAPNLAPAPVEAKPQPVVLATTVPKAPSPTVVADDVTVLITDASASLGAASKSALRSSFNLAALGRCYRDAVQSSDHSSTPMSAEIEFSTNSSGRVTAARASGATLTPTLTRCIEEAARLGRVREADTGELRATVKLRFFVR